ncbi:hypothetical protein [Mesorhizobium sp. WSM3868]|uniref:hypothetical protein n=1 Tax=Mesorhizobium sp. WSM3868 TaxID=2029405 RepID=UPI000BB08740|nr:hypothetical protein [Mesorhizobium sp. WSM3868]
MVKLKASVQYGDFEGTAAADDGHDQSFHNFLLDKGVLSKDDFVVGVEIWVGENHGGPSNPPTIRALVAPAAGFDAFKGSLTRQEKLRLREVEVELSFEEFFGLFKRFSIVLTKRGLELGGREYEPIESNRNRLSHRPFLRRTG